MREEAPNSWPDRPRDGSVALLGLYLSLELNPRRDVLGTTEVVAAKLVKELAALMLRTTPAG